MAISISDLNLNKQCEQPAQLELIGTDGQPLGVSMMVLGAHAKQVQDFITSSINAKRAKQAMDAKFSRKKADYVKVEDDIDFSVESVAVRIVSWSGITEECNRENAVKLCTINADICSQVREFSEDLGNFTKG